MGTWRDKMEKARRLHRPSLKDWTSDDMYNNFPPFVSTLQKEPNYTYFRATEYKLETKPQQLPVVLNAKHCSREEFFSYERKSIPAVIKNIPAGYDGGEATDPWPAQEKWQLKNLLKDVDLLDRKFKCGEDDDGRNIKIRLLHFLNYTQFNHDDSPLYIFDSNFDEDKYADRILRDYRVPSYFSDDLFGLVSESRRPPYRWFLIGPERSGTCVHIDPLGTSAWNTLVEGRKRWVLFPPHVPKSIVKGRGLVRDDEDDEAVHYFMTILPRIKRKARSLRGTPQYENFCCYEFTQNSGETVFVPNGWWHAVLNLNHTVAVTQNFCSPRNFDKVWVETRKGRKLMAWKWLNRLQVEYPELYERARAINAADGFVMKYEEREKEEHEERERADRRKNQEHQSKWEFDDGSSRKRGTAATSKKKLKKGRHNNMRDSRATVSP